MTNRKTACLYIALICAALCMPYAPATAEEFDVDYRTLESLGIYESEYEGSLGSDLWNNATRSNLIALIEKIPEEPKSKTSYRLQKHALLTQARVSFSGQPDPEGGKDLLTIRMEKLIAMGAYPEALALYRTMNAEPYHPALARTGILAMLYTGQKALACIEAKTMKDRFKEDGFWQDFKAYCSVSLSEKATKEEKGQLKDSKRKILQSLANDKKYSFSYAPDDFEKLTWLEQAALGAEQKLTTGTLNKESVHKIPLRHISLLLLNENIDENNKTFLTIEAARRGIYGEEELVNLYEALYKLPKGEEPTEPKTSRGKLGYFYSQLIQAKSDEKWNIIKQAFDLQKTYDIDALIPFATILGSIRPEAPQKDDIKNVILLFAAAGQPLPAFWAEALDSLPEEAKEGKDWKNLKILAHILQSERDRKSNETVEIITLTDGFDTKKKALLKIIIENIDTANKIVHNAPVIYEKDFDIASTLVYKVPQVDVWDRLENSIQNKIKSETILLSATLINAGASGDMYPGVMRDVLNSLNAVGLTSFSRDVAKEAILED